MSLFKRKPKQSEPVPETTLYNSQTTIMPIAPTAVIPIVETIKTVTPNDVQFCACCHAVGARHALRIGDFYLKSFLVYLCNECMDRRIEAACYHHFGQRKIPPDTLVRLEAINLAKTKVLGVVQANEKEPA